MKIVSREWQSEVHHSNSIDNSSLNIMQIQFEFICYFQKYHLSRCHMSGPERVNFSPCIQRMMALGFSMLR